MEGDNVINNLFETNIFLRILMSIRRLHFQHQ